MWTRTLPYTAGEGRAQAPPCPHPLISKLDATALRDRVHVAVVYVGPQQDSWAQALRNEHCSAGLAAFLAALGCETPARGLLGPAAIPQRCLAADESNPHSLSVNVMCVVNSQCIGISILSE